MTGSWNLEQTSTMVMTEDQPCSLNKTQEAFIVQRCWFSGPDIHQPLDYLRLFGTRREAEEAAYHSAYAWARSKSPKDPAVKTLLLPSNPTSNSAPVASYGFVSQGSLFWVRPTSATMVTDTDSVSQPQQGPGGISDGHNMAYAVVTEGVIGGTGNRNSRRGTEVSEGRVFCGSSRTAHILALQVCHSVIECLPAHCTTYVANLVVGKPIEYESARFLQEWPPQVGRHMAVDNDNNGKRGNYCLSPKAHRESYHQQPSHPLAAIVSSTFAERSRNANNFIQNYNSDIASLFQQQQQSAPKRRRMDDKPWQTGNTATFQSMVEDEMVM